MHTSDFIVSFIIRKQEEESLKIALEMSKQETAGQGEEAHDDDDDNENNEADILGIPSHT